MDLTDFEDGVTAVCFLSVSPPSAGVFVSGIAAAEVTDIYFKHRNNITELDNGGIAN